MSTTRTYTAAALGQKTLTAFVGLLLCSVVLAILYDALWLYAVPAMILAIAAVILDYRILYIGFFALVPFSTEVYLPMGLGTDLPTEPLMWGLTGVALILLITKWNKIDYRYLLHPISILVALHVSWIGLSILTSSQPTISLKYFLAKLWYIIPWYVMTLVIVKDYKILRKCFLVFSYCLALSVGTVIIRFIPYDLDFAYIEKIMYPFFRNHVNYAAIMAVALPWIWALWTTSTSKKTKTTLVVLGAFMVFAIVYSYTRAAILSIPIAIGCYWLIRLRLLKIAIGGGLIAALLLISYLITDRTWLDYAPDYDKTITHRDFNDLISATAKGEDISTMERVYRWVAAGHMISERPIMGFGPGTFYHNYRPYTVSAFETYVSDNPQKSGIHSYYLMVWVDQGSVGLMLFLVLVVWVLLHGEWLYHRLADASDRIWTMAAMLCLLILDAIMLINDMLEVDKTGPFYFISIALIVSISIRGRYTTTKS